MVDSAQPPEEIIRTHLEALEDPTRAIDEAAVLEQEAVGSAVDDVIDRLDAPAALARLRHPDLTEIEAAFVSVERDWALENQVSAAAFLEVGVPASVLRRAGFESPSDGRCRVARLIQLEQRGLVHVVRRRPSVRP